MKEPAYTLRQITDAMCAVGLAQDRTKTYDRARMLRDGKKGSENLIQSSLKTSQGKTMLLADADVVAAVVAISASLNGQSWNLIAHINGFLRPSDLGGYSMQDGGRKYEDILDAVNAAAPIFVRVDIMTGDIPGIVARLGTVEEIGLITLADDVDQETTIILLPVSKLALPVLQYLRDSE